MWGNSKYTVKENWHFLVEQSTFSLDCHRFKDCCEIRNGQVDPRTDVFMGLPLVAPNHIEPRTGKLLDVESANEQEAISGKFLVSQGDVIYSKIRPALRKACIAPMDCLCSADMYAIKPNESVDNTFLLWVLLCDPFSES